MEFTMDTDTRVPDARQGVSNIQPIVSEVGNEPMDPHTNAPNVDRNVLENWEDVDDRDSAVRHTHTLPDVQRSLITA